VVIQSMFGREDELGTLLRGSLCVASVCSARTCGASVEPRTALPTEANICLRVMESPLPFIENLWSAPGLQA
jgi:hypothetical protein